MLMRKDKTILIILMLTVFATIFSSACTPPKSEERDNHWLELLNILPANQSTFNGAYLRDDAYKTEIIKKYPEAESPLSPDDSAFVIPLFGESPHRYSDQAWQAELGFVRTNVSKTIYAGVPPAVSYQAACGSFDESKIDNAVKTGPYKVTPEIITYQGYEYYSWGQDNQPNLQMQTPVRPLGRGYRLALVDNFVFWVPRTAQIQEMIDSYENNIDSLADLGSYRELSATLVEANTFRAFFSAASYSIDNIKEAYKSLLDEPVSNEKVKYFIDELQNPSAPLLKQFEALATGVGIDDTGYFLLIALYNGTTAAAKQNAALLEQRIEQVAGPASDLSWWDITTEINVSYEGQITMAKLYGEATRYWDDFAIQGFGMVQPLVIHE